MDRESRWKDFLNLNLERLRDNLCNVSPLAVEFADTLERDGLDRVLDLGCGLGRHMLYMAERGFEVIGCDISEETLMEAEENAKSRDLNLTFVQGDYIDLPFHNNVFSGVLCLQTLHHDFPESFIRGFKEIRRIMKQGGYLALDPLSTNDGYFGRGRPLGEKLFLQDRIPHYFFDEDEIVDLLERLFFKIIKLEKHRYVSTRGNGAIKRERFLIIARKERAQNRFMNVFQRLL